MTIKTLTIDIDKQVVVPKKPNYFELQETSEVYGLDFNKFCAAYNEAVLRVSAAAPQPESVESEPVYQIRPDADNWIDCSVVFFNEWKGEKRKLYSHPQPDRTAELEAALKVAKNNLHGINLCSINSMSSRHEMRRLADEALAKINEVLNG